MYGRRQRDADAYLSSTESHAEARVLVLVPQVSVCLHTYINTYIRMYIHTYISAYIHDTCIRMIHTYIHTCIHTHTHENVYVCESENVCVCVCRVCMVAQVSGPGQPALPSLPSVWRVLVHAVLAFEEEGGGGGIFLHGLIGFMQLSCNGRRRSQGGGRHRTRCGRGGSDRA
jgi:hypothetical protein